MDAPLLQEAEARIQQLISELEAAQTAAKSHAEEGNRMQEILR